MAEKKTSRSNRKTILLRYSFISALILLFCAGILYKLVDTTVISADKWNELANRELSKTEVIAPERGDILAADGSVLATNPMVNVPYGSLLGVMTEDDDEKNQFSSFRMVGAYAMGFVTLLSFPYEL